MTDLRLVWPAIAAWASCALVLSLPGLASGWLAVGALAGAACACMALLRVGRSGARVVCVSVAAAMLTVGAVVLHLLSISDGPVSGLAEARAEVSVTGVISSDPSSSAAIGGGDRWQARVRLSSVDSGDARFEIDVPIVVYASSEFPAVGSVVKATGRLGAVPMGRDVSASLNAHSVELLSGPDPLAAAANEVRAGLARSLDGVDPDAAALVAGLAVGDESRAPAVLVADMRNAGLSHLTAVSGGNVMIVLAVVLLLGRLLALRIPWRVLLAAASLVFFVVLVRPEPSVLRAAVMGAISLLALTSGSRSRGIPALCAAVIVLVLLAPSLALSLGFVLSVFATAGLLLLAPIVRARLDAGSRTRRLPEALRIAIAVAVAAQVTTAPVIAALGNGLSIVSVPANLLAAPVVPAVTLLGLGAAVASVFSPHLAWLLAHLAAPGAAWISFIAHRAAALPLGVVPWPAGVLGGVLVVAVAVAAVALARAMRHRGVRLPLPLVVAFAAAVLIVVCLRPPGAWPPTGWVLVACDVGQGDGLVVRVGESSGIVIDTGPEPVAITRCLRDLGITDVPAVVLTHFHADHAEGLTGVLAAFPVGGVYVSPVRDPLTTAMKVEEECEAAGVAVVPVTAGDVRTIGAVQWQAVWPARVIKYGSVPNNSSVVLVVQAYGLRILLTGDVESAAQVAVRTALAGAAIDVAKVPHHGSRMADASFPASVHPTVALISVGRGNDYGHPAPGTMALWESTGAVVGRTDLDGDLAVLADRSVVRRGVIGE